MGQSRRLQSQPRMLQLLFLRRRRRRNQRARQIPAARQRTGGLARRRLRAAPEPRRSPARIRLPLALGHRCANRLQLLLRERAHHHLQRMRPYRQTHPARLLRLRFARHRLRHPRHRLSETRICLLQRTAQRTRAQTLSP